MSEWPRKGFTPFGWQTKAVNQWDQAGRRGIVEAVTAAGKSFVALEAMYRVLRENKKVSILVVVPKVAIADQWEDRLTKCFPGNKVGRIGGGRADDFSKQVIACVAIINSAVPRLNHLFRHISRDPAWRTMLIADECHNYIQGEVWSRLLKDHRFDYTLGLSATIFEYEVEGLGRNICQYSFKDAHHDGLVPSFDLMNVDVQFNHEERDEYVRLTSSMRFAWQDVMGKHGPELANVPEPLFFATLRRIMKRGASSEEEYDPAIRRLFGILFKRVSLAYTAETKMTLADAAIREMVLVGRRKVMVFFERIESSEAVLENIELQAAKDMKSRFGDSFWCEVYHSGIRPKERQQLLAKFQAAGPCALLACRALDEGIDIPDVDGAILVASTQSKRQRIQRIGRSLRRGQDKSKPVILSFHVEGTTDQNAAEDDRKTFDGVAQVTWVKDHSCLQSLKLILASNPETPQCNKG